MRFGPTIALEWEMPTRPQLPRSSREDALARSGTWPRAELGREKALPRPVLELVDSLDQRVYEDLSLGYEDVSLEVEVDWECDPTARGPCNDVDEADDIDIDFDIDPTIEGYFARDIPLPLLFDDVEDERPTLPRLPDPSGRRVIQQWMVLVPAALAVAFAFVVGRELLIQTANHIEAMLTSAVTRHST